MFEIAMTLTLNKPRRSLSNRTRLLEITAVALTGLGKFLLVDYLHLKFWYVTLVCLVWTVYILFRIRADRSLPGYWGFRKEGFKSSLKIVLPLSIVLVTAFVIVGKANDTLILNWHLLPILVLYPLWATIQQFLIIGLITRNLDDYEGKDIPKSVILVVASTVFSIVHYPSVPLMVATLFLAMLYTVLYLKYRNLWVLGLFHGWLGGFFYYFVLGRDAWLEFIQAIQ
jgi:hypothetical protein